MGDAARIETGQKRVRTYVGGELVADTRRPLLVWEKPYYPTYYIPAEDVRAGLEPTPTPGPPIPGSGPAEVLTVVTGRGDVPGAARRYPGAAEPLRGAVRFEWSAMDEWLEEEEPVYVHPRDPYKRVDILASSRHVRVDLDGVTLAESRSPRILFETGLPPRYYLPLADLRMDLLRSSDTRTHCPYKGSAEYRSVRVGDVDHADLVWIYRYPVPESQKIAGLACFYNERVDLVVDGVPQERPRTPFS